ncbi:helix-turn-helix domain-containing protein [Actinomadura sp. NPDC047616]|uniref:helix-turn-helix domain-containing protein n=1 Tax=Actinomadura sp. NPDC047616 TaxID=3155914 RepID=UPI00340F5C7A
MTATDIRPAATTETRHNDDTGTQDAVSAPAPDPRSSGAGGAVWDALNDYPGSTVAAIAEAAGVSKATTARTLTALEKNGQATRIHRTRKGGKRTPDTWHPVTVTIAPEHADTDDDPSTAEKATEASSGHSDAPQADNHDTGSDETAETPDPARDASETELDATAVAEAREALTTMAAAISAALEALDSGDRTEALTATETVYSGSAKARRLVRAAVNGRPRSASGRVRSQPGEMRAKVAAHLAAHPGAEFTPHEVSKVIGHSAGAVANALDRLVSTGEAEMTCERPRRYTAARTTEDAAATSETATP